ncbi:NAC domain-containing protein 71-like [Durio zibethinus]|uniref:NAC domain-containing protein 71-like n=1 Tax=Durio zibethinus TaxID=66656 RepID=A0A6P5WR28_DURZI|nr:NAC domain-containing protein 71-like [Durio zibethinus]
MAPMSLPPGFRFHPTDEELVAYYLDRKITGRTIEFEIIPEVDLYKCEPWDLPDKSFLPSKDMEWYFYGPRDKKYPNGSRTNRATRAGYWKATGKDRAVHSQKRAVGMKKTLVYYRGRAPHGIRTNWVMHEYRLVDSACGTAPSSLKDSYALCRIFKKNIQIPKTKKEAIENNNVGKDMARAPEEQLFGDDASGYEILRGREVEFEDENFNTSSSDVTQGTPNETGMADDYQPPTTSDEANSSANMCSLGVDFSSDLIQMPGYTNLHYQVPFPPLELEDFPQINISETKSSKAENIDEYMIYDKYRDYINGSLEEIFSLCSSKDNSMPLSMYD